MTDEELRAYLDSAVQDYAQEHVRAGNWSASEAQERAEKEFQQLLPNGVATKNQYLFAIEDTAEVNKVGMLWFAVSEGRPHPMAFIYDFVISEPFRRKGYAMQALLVLEDKVKGMGIDTISLHVFAHNQAARALYEKMGYVTTDIQMSKTLEHLR